MTVVRLNSRSPKVKELQKILNAVMVPSPKLVPDGVFGVKTQQAVIAFQTSAQLKADGVVGPKTWRALASIDPVSTPIASRFNTPQAPLADIAKRYIGVKETPENRAGKDAKLLEIFQADDLMINGKTDGYPWCAAFVSLCVQKLCQQSLYFGTLTPPREPSVSRFLTVWAKHENCIVFEPNAKGLTPAKGDIVVFKFSHIGIVEQVNGKVLTTIEGNTNDAGSREGNVVARKSRTTAIVRAFIRLPVSITMLESRIIEISRLC